MERVKVVLPKSRVLGEKVGVKKVVAWRALPVINPCTYNVFDRVARVKFRGEQSRL